MVMSQVTGGHLKAPTQEQRTNTGNQQVLQRQDEYRWIWVQVLELCTLAGSGIMNGD